MTTFRPATLHAQVCGLGPLSPSEQAGLQAMRTELLGSINKGVTFVQSKAGKA
jgi:hypothetical protein